MTSATQPALRTRVPLWDNARFFFIVLVVVGHTISTIRTDSHLAFVLYAYIYLVHMPAMMLISGVFMKPEVTSKSVKQVVQLLSIWVIWETLWVVLRWLVQGQMPRSTWLITPAWTLWFLVSLATMRILLPYIARLRHPLLWSLVIALLAGASPVIGTEFSVARTLCFLPFFVAGWLAQSRGWFSLTAFVAPTRNLKTGAWAVLLAVAGVLVFIPNVQQLWRIDTWLTWRSDYLTLFSTAPIGTIAPDMWATATLSGIGVRLVLLGVGFALCWAWLTILPRTSSVITTWGTRTLTVYLLHGPIIYALRHTSLVNTLGEWSLLLVIGVGVGIAIFLSLAPFTRLARPLIEPRTTWLWGSGTQRAVTPAS